MIPLVWGKPGESARIVVAGKGSDTVPSGRPLAFGEQAVWYEQLRSRVRTRRRRGWGACLPDLPGVVALGMTRDEVSERIQEALDAYAEERAALGQALPDPVAATGTVQAV